MAIPPITMPDASGPTPTLDDVRAAYLLHADWEEYRDSDQATAVSRCRAFVTAGKRLMLMLPKVSSTRQRTTAELSPELIHQELTHARKYLAIAGGAFAGDGADHVDLTHFRD